MLSFVLWMFVKENQNKKIVFSGNETFSGGINGIVKTIILGY